MARYVHRPLRAQPAGRINLAPMLNRAPFGVNRERLISPNLYSRSPQRASSPGLLFSLGDPRHV